jgi:hypothetical protein
MNTLAAAKLVISLLVTMPGSGEQYAMQTWAPANAKEFATDWRTCEGLVKDIEISGRDSRVPKVTGIKAKCDVAPEALVPGVVNPQAKAASLQTVRF